MRHLKQLKRELSLNFLQQYRWHLSFARSPVTREWLCTCVSVVTCFELVAFSQVLRPTCCGMTAAALTVFTMVLFSISILPKLNSFSVVVSNARRTSKLSRCVSMRSMSMKTDGVSEPETQRLINQASAWCALNGLLYSAGDMKFTMAPVSLIPNSFSKSSFEYAQNVQPILNELVDKISRDKSFLTQNLQSVGESDKFVRRLLGKILISLLYTTGGQN